MLLALDILTHETKLKVLALSQLNCAGTNFSVLVVGCIWQVLIFIVNSYCCCFLLITGTKWRAMQPYSYTIEVTVIITSESLNL